jgi:hypothetical protein
LQRERVVSSWWRKVCENLGEIPASGRGSWARIASQLYAITPSTRGSWARINAIGRGATGTERGSWARKQTLEAEGLTPTQVSSWPRALGETSAFSPLDVSPYVLLQPSLTTLFQGLAGSTPVTTAGQTVASATNLGSIGGFFEQSTAGSRPVYGTDGTLHWLTGDGSDDWLQIDSLGLTRPYAIYAALRTQTAFFSRFIGASDSFVIANGNISGGTTPLSLSDAFSAAIDSTIPVTTGSDHVVGVHVLPNGQTSRIAVDEEAWVEGNLQSAVGLDSLALLADVGGAGPAGGRIYAALVCPIPTDEQDAELRTWLATQMPA